MGLTIQELDLSTNGSWKILLDNGIAVILGKTGLSERMTRFMLAYQHSLQAQSQQIAYIDLRYTNGFAIGWKAGATMKKERANLKGVSVKEVITHNVQETR